jgi:hypothetical protein
VAVFDKRNRLRLAATNARRHTRRGIARGDSTRKLTRRFGKRLRRVSRNVLIVRGSKRSRSRVVYAVRKGKVRYVAIVDRKLAKKRRALRTYLRRAKL